MKAFLRSKMARLAFPNRHLIMSLVVLVFLFTFYLVYEDIKDRTINEFNNEQLILARTAAQGITSFFLDSQSDLSFLSQIEGIRDFTSESESLLASFYENHKNLIAAVTRVDARGVILSTYPYDQSVIGKDISYQNHVSQIMTTHEQVISDVFMAVQGYPAIALHVPVMKETEYLGSLAILIPIDELGKLYLGNIDIRGTGTVCLLSENNIVLFSPVKEHTGKSFLDFTRNDDRTTELLYKVKTENSGTARRISQQTVVDGSLKYIEKYVAFYRAPLGNTYWTILISCQEKDIYIALTRLRNRLILVFSLLLIIISHYFYSLAKMRNALREEAERKKAAKILQASEEKFRDLFENSPVGNSMITIDGFMNVNKSFCDILGYNEDELKLKKWPEITFPDDIQLSDEIIRSLSEGKAKKARYEKRFIHKNGSIIWADVSTYLQRDKENKPQFFITAVIDITSRKQAAMELIAAKEKAEESDRLKSAFLANMSHEIRTPMNGILGFAGLLKEPGLKGEKQQEYIQIIEKSGARMLNIINDIVDISKIESGQMQVSLSDTNINRQLEDICSFFKPETEKKAVGLGIIKTLSDERAFIKTDSDKLYAILINLVKNAIKYTHHGSIVFGYELNGSMLKFFVKDTGIGIPPDRQGPIFRRFIQADVEDKKAYQGAGLGLAISKAYIEMLGGEIWVESELQKGSTFYFTHPFNSVTAEKPSEKRVNAVPMQGNQVLDLKILIVEDDEISAKLLTRMVMNFGREVLIAKNGQNAIEICRRNPDIDLVLMDIQMPEMNGYDATHQIRQFNNDVVIIAQTAFALSGDFEKALNAGCNDYISKPINKDLLAKKIAEFFSTKT